MDKNQSKKKIRKRSHKSSNIFEKMGNTSEMKTSSETLNNSWLEEQEEIIDECICGRKPKTLVCVNCKMFTYGRITMKCPKHANVTFLMDFISCPNCQGPAEMLRGVDIEYSQCNNVSQKGNGVKSGVNRFQNNY